MFLAYLLGSISGSLMLGRLKGTDIRDQGSGNAGATNALRTQGLLFAIGVALIDVGKGMLATGWIPHLEWIGGEKVVDLQWLMAGCGMAAVIGHIYPFWHQFRGGKGAATLIGAYCMLAPKLIIPALLVFFVSVVSSGFVGLSTMLAVIACALLCLMFYSANEVLVLFSVVMAVVIIFAHRANIRRMINGTENRMQRVMIWRK